MASKKQTPDTDLEEDAAIVSREGEDLEHDLSSDFNPQTTESSEEPEDELQTRRPRRHPHGGVVRRASAPDVTREQFFQQTRARQEMLDERRRLRIERQRRYYEVVRRGRWQDREKILEEDREEFEYAWFGKAYPILAQLEIPAARRRAIMAVNLKGKGKKKSSKKGKEIGGTSSKHEIDVSQQNNPTLHPSGRTFLTLLPLEIQLQILRYCLTTEKSLIDFCFGYHFATSELSTDRNRGHNPLSPGILATNRHFRTLGLGLFWQENNFIYTRSDEYTLLDTNILMKLPQITQIRNLTIHQDSIWPQQMFYDRVTVDTTLFAISVTEQLPALQSLHINFVSTDILPYWHERGKRLCNSLLEAQHFLRDLHGGRSLRGLQQVSLSGVSDDDMGSLVIKLASSLISNSGFLGLGYSPRAAPRSSLETPIGFG